MADPAERADPDDLAKRKAPLARVVGELLNLSPWKKRLLGLFVVIAAIGGVMWTHGRLNAETVTVERPAVVQEDAPPVFLSDAGPAAGFVGGRPVDDDGIALEPADREQPAEDIDNFERQLRLPWTGRLGGWLAKFGLSFAVGLVIGVFFRTFLKTMAVITAVAVGAVVGLSYFEVLPIDFATMRQNYDSAADVVGGQAEAAKDFVIDYLPSATAAGLGFFTGFLRR